MPLLIPTILCHLSAYMRGGFGEGCLSVDLSIGKQNIDAMFSLPRV